MLNVEKNISENQIIGVLPPQKIHNIKLCLKDDIYGVTKLNPNLEIRKDYILVNQLLWEWFLLNYEGGPEITVETNIDISYLKKDLLLENNLSSHKNHNELERKTNNLDENYEEDKKYFEEVNSYDINKNKEKENNEINEIKIGIKIKNLFQKDKNE